MWEILSLWTVSYIVTWPFLAVLFLAGVLFEYKQSHKFAVFLGIIVALVSYFYFNIPKDLLLEILAGYVPVGLVWSFWRYHRYVQDYIEVYKANPGSSLAYIVESLAPGKNIDLITMWVIIWPFSAVESVLGDFISIIQTLITKVFKSVYNKIYTSHIESLKASVKK